MAQYDVVARDYARLIAPKYAPIAQLVAARVPELDGGLVVEPGVGTGLLTTLVAGRSRPQGFVGVDVSAGMLAIARANVPSWVTLVQARGELLPLPDASAALMVSSLGPVQETAEGLREAARVLRPGASIVTASWGEGYAELDLLQRARTRIGAGDYPVGVAEALEQRVRDAGFHDLGLEQFRLQVVHDSVDDYIAYRAAFGQMSWLPSGAHETWLETVREETARYADADGRVRLDWVIIVLSATAK